MTAESPFKRGTTYTRKEVGWILLPETGRPAGGNWDTGYVRVDNFLVVFMNIGVPGKGGFDFDNEITFLTVSGINQCCVVFLTRLPVI